MRADLAWALAAALEFGEQHALRLTPTRAATGAKEVALDQLPRSVATSP